MDNGAGAVSHYPSQGSIGQGIPGRFVWVDTARQRGPRDGMDSDAPHHTANIQEEKKPAVPRPIASSHVSLVVQPGLGARLLTLKHIPV